MLTPAHICVIEDEPKIAALLKDFLEASGFTSSWAADGSEAINHIAEHKPDLVILDLMLPNVDGLTICRKLRAVSDVPIIMVTAKVDEIDRLLGLELGADDYICKPFSPREVVARVRTILRRIARASSEAREDDDTIVYEHLSVSASRHIASAATEPLDLTPVEFRLLTTLIKQPGRVFSREKLMAAAYEDFRVVSDRTIDSHIKNLRHKITKAGEFPDLLRSIYGVGYKLE